MRSPGRSRNCNGPIRILGCRCSFRGADGENIEFGFELGAPVFNIRLGWRKDSIVPGDTVTVVYCPSKNGSPRGTLMYVHLPSGEVLSGVAPRIYSGPSVEDPAAVPAPPLLSQN